MKEPITTGGNGRFKAGNPGRPVGPNKLTKTVKETVLNVFNQLQEDSENSLLQFAKKHPRDFYAIAAKLIPTDIRADINSFIQVEQITGMVVKKKDAA